MSDEASDAPQPRDRRPALSPGCERSIASEVCTMERHSDRGSDLDPSESTFMPTSATPPASPISVVPYCSQYRGDFERLNRIWLEEHSLLETADLEYMQDPEGLILAPGGQVFFALDGDRVIGTAAVIPERDGVMELAKLAVDPAARGRGIGKQLTLAILAFARERGAHTVVLTSNSALTTAIRLYQSLGFEHAPMPSDVRYQTADVYMRLSL